jgi:hypothetical protein
MAYIRMDSGFSDQEAVRAFKKLFDRLPPRSSVVVSASTRRDSNPPRECSSTSRSNHSRSSSRCFSRRRSRPASRPSDRRREWHHQSFIFRVAGDVFVKLPSMFMREPQIWKPYPQDLLANDCGDHQEVSVPLNDDELFRLCFRYDALMFKLAKAPRHPGVTHPERNQVARANARHAKAIQAQLNATEAGRSAARVMQLFHKEDES